METIDELKQQLSDSQARECAVREALAEARDTMSSECSDGCTWGDGWEHDDPKLIARIDAVLATPSAPCPHEQRVRELEAELDGAKRAAKVLIHEHTERQKERDKALAGLTAERERFDWLTACNEAMKHEERAVWGKLITSASEENWPPDRWRTEIDKARSSAKSFVNGQGQPEAKTVNPNQL